MADTKEMKKVLFGPVLDSNPIASTRTGHLLSVGNHHQVGNSAGHVNGR